MRLISVPLLFGAVAMAACSHAEQSSSVTPVTPTAAAATEPAPHSHHQESPIEATLRGPDVIPASGEVELVLQLTRSMATMAPIRVDVTLPAGVDLIAGVASDVVTDTTATSIERRFKLRYPSIPTTDALFVVDWQTKAAGFHAKLPYRFGRPAPATAEPARLPTETRLPGGTSLGRPILTK
jgi:hypothetical protein